MNDRHPLIEEAVKKPGNTDGQTTENDPPSKVDQWVQANKDRLKEIGWPVSRVRKYKSR